MYITITRNEAIRQVQEKTGVKVDHLLIFRVDNNRGYRDRINGGILQHDMTTHFMNEDGTEIGYISHDLSVAPFIFDTPRIWCDEIKSKHARQELPASMFPMAGEQLELEL